MIDGVTMHARSLGNQLLNFGRNSPHETCCRLAGTMAWLARKYSPQIVVEIGRPFKRVLLSLAVVMLAQRNPNLRQCFNFFPDAILRSRPRDLTHEIINVFKLPQCRPATIPTPPIRARLQPNRERLGKIFGGMGLRVPRIKI